MLKIITSVVLSLVTIMAVTLFAVTVPAQSQKIDENAAAIVKAQTDAENNAYNKVKEDILSDMSGNTLEDVGTAISALQDDVSDLENKKLYLHSISFVGTNSEKYQFNYISKTQKYNSASDFFNDIPVNFTIYTNTDGTNVFGFYKQSSQHFTRLYMASGNQSAGSYISISAVTSFSDTSYAIN